MQMATTTFERELIAERLRSALADACLTTDAFAGLLGTSRPRLSTYLNGRTMPSAALYERALKTAAALKSARMGGWMTVDNAIDEINKALGEGDSRWAFKLIVQARDHLSEMLDSGDAGSDAWLFRSRQIEDSRYDTLLAAIIEHEFIKRQCRQVPEWAHGARLESAWMQPNARWGEEWTRQHTPDWLSARNIIISDRDLATARSASAVAGSLLGSARRTDVA